MGERGNRGGVQGSARRRRTAKVQGHYPRAGRWWCNVIFKDTGGVIGRWSSWETASRALNQLQKLGGHYEYRLEERHRWVKGAGATAKCTLCNTTRQIASAVSIPWL